MEHAARTFCDIWPFQFRNLVCIDSRTNAGICDPSIAPIQSLKNGPEVQGVPDLIWDEGATCQKLDIGAVDVLQCKHIQDPMNTPCSKAQSLW